MSEDIERNFTENDGVDRQKDKEGAEVPRP